MGKREKETDSFLREKTEVRQNSVTRMMLKSEGDSLY